MAHLLPILWGGEPTPADWAALKEAKTVLGYDSVIQPARAVNGSPGRILAVGDTPPDWVCDYAQVASAQDPDLSKALGWCLGLNDYDNTPDVAAQLSRMMGCEVTFLYEEEV